MYKCREHENPFLPNTLITDLGFGGGFALWGTRAIAAGHGNCRQLSIGFNQAFSLDIEMDYKTDLKRGQGASGRLAMNALKSFVTQLGRSGQRAIKLSSSGSMQLTADEASLVAVLSAAQNGDEFLSSAHLRWLLGGKDYGLTYQAARTYGQVCRGVGMSIIRPDIRFPAEQDITDPSICSDYKVKALPRQSADLILAAKS